ncbi:MAG TPA: peptide chain release factor 2 [Polyangiales bacterium]|nr:peptide chain release factor 2 [Polyangiales bacterium]
MTLTISEQREALADLVQRLTALGRYLDVDALRHRIESLNHDSQAPGFWDDQERAQKLLQERSGYESTVERHEKLTKEANDLTELLELAAEDESLLDELSEQIPALVEGVRRLELMRMLSGHEDKSDAIVSIHPGAGGVEAQDWSEMLMRMYLRWCEKKGYKTEMLDHQAGEEAGIKDATFVVRGPNAYGFLRSENGVHRLIRISPFDANARRQTSFSAVDVVPDLDDDVGDIEIRPEDLRVDTYRAQGAGGQHVNKTESAVRFTHLPTGIVVACQQERSQHKNRALAMKMLRGRLYERARQEKEAAFEAAYGGDKSGINFGSQIRSYTMAPYTLVKDERTELKVAQVDAVLDGDIDDFIEAFLLMKANRKAAAEKTRG